MSIEKKATAIDWELCLQKMSGNQALAQEFLVCFIEELFKNREELVQLFAEKNILGLENAAHKLHGACCFCGVLPLQTQAAHMEREASKATSIERLQTIFSELLLRIDEVIEEFTRCYREKQ